MCHPLFCNPHLPFPPKEVVVTVIFPAFGDKSPTPEPFSFVHRLTGEQIYNLLASSCAPCLNLLAFPLDFTFDPLCV